jgi:DNA invertase Pin-like site-specific DNA recombinase
LQISIDAATDLIAALAEFERELIGERVRSRIARVSARKSNPATL